MNGLPPSACRSPLATVIAAAGLWLLPALASADWLHYRGPTQNGVVAEKGFNAQFGQEGPKELWKASLGTGTASVTVSSDRAWSAGNLNGKDVVYCLDVKTGKEVWRHDYDIELDPNMFEGGPRATPTVDGTRIYMVSHKGDLRCINAADGKLVWSQQYQKDFGGERPQWGYSGSVTIEGNLAIADVGGKGASTVAFDKATGKVAWKSGDDAPGYASPVVATIDGKRTVVVFKAEHLVGLSLQDGKELWRTPWKTEYNVNAATPLVLGNQILISSGYNTGAALYSVAGGKISQVWKNKNLRSHINSPVPLNGAIYGLDGKTDGNLVCLDLASGNVKWTEKSVKGGALILADGKLIVLTEKGDLVTAAADPGAFKPISRAKVLDKRCWVQPTLSGGRLFVKDNEGNLRCLDLHGAAGLAEAK